MSKINEITPIKDGMDKESASDSVKNFLSHVLQISKHITTHDIQHQVVEKLGNRIQCEVISLKDDGTKWVKGNGGLERLVGAAYLDKQIKDHKLDILCKIASVEIGYTLKKATVTVKIKRAEDSPLKNILTIGSDDIISYSKYEGNTGPEVLPVFRLIDVKAISGYKDFEGNLRENEDGSLTIIDTEYASFQSDKALPLSKITCNELGGQEFTYNVVDILGADA